MAVDLVTLAEDLSAETIELERLLVPLGADGWAALTPAPGWRVHDQISHLAYFDDASRLATVEPDQFRVQLEVARTDPEGITERVRQQYAGLAPAELLQWFRSARVAMLRAFGDAGPSARVPWFGPDMSVASLCTARIMETWAHGQDVADALGTTRAPTRALRQVAYLGVRTLPNSFIARGRDVPDRPVFVELDAPGGERWSWGEATAADRVAGDAIEFCLVVTQRRNLSDTALRITGPVAKEWMTIAQAFAGPPGEGRAPVNVK
jgi:uncharacterized protein (TIGR03084 family)